MTKNSTTERQLPLGFIEVTAKMFYAGPDRSPIFGGTRLMLLNVSAIASVTIDVDGDTIIETPTNGVTVADTYENIVTAIAIAGASCAFLKVRPDTPLVTNDGMKAAIAQRAGHKQEGVTH